MFRKDFFVLLLLISSISGFSKGTVSKLEWKAGQSKQLTIRLSVKEVENGVLAMDTSLTTKSNVKVLEINEDYCLIRLSNENQLLRFGSSYCEGLGDKLSDVKNLGIDIKIDKKSLSAQIDNHEEYHKKLKESRDEILEVIENRYPEKLDLVASKLDELFTTLQKNEEVLKTMDLVLEAYKTKYSYSDTIVCRDTLTNPFKLMNFNGAEIKSYVRQKEGSDSYEIVAERSYDFDAYKKLMSNLTEQAGATMGVVAEEENGSQATNQMSEMLNALLSTYEFGASEMTIITLQRASDWPARLQKKSELTINVANNETVILADVSIDIQ